MRVTLEREEIKAIYDYLGKIEEKNLDKMDSITITECEITAKLVVKEDKSE